MRFSCLNGLCRYAAALPALCAAFILLAGTVTAAAHGRDAVPSEDEWRKRYQEGLAAHYNDDNAAAIEAWTAVAERPTGSSAAQLFLGFIHANGLGVERDAAAAVDWYRRAAAQDHPLAQIRLAMLLGSGDGLANDLVQAYAWASMAARLEGHLQGVAVALREVLEKKMSPEQLADARSLAARWAESHSAGE